EREQYFYGHGKLLLSGEYLVMQGAQALALPTLVGQSLSVRYQRSYQPKIHWKCLDIHDHCWFEAVIEPWHFDLIDGVAGSEFTFLQKLLRQARKQNPHFLRERADVVVETRLEFPQDWGLGSSSSLIYNIAQWAYVSPF